jgi:hypothetical protein
MLHVVEIGADDTIKLPADVMQVFEPADRLMVVIQGDTIMLKRIKSVNVLDRVAETPDDEPPPSMDEINEIVHEVRRQQRHNQDEQQHEDRS